MRLGRRPSILALATLVAAFLLVQIGPLPEGSAAGAAHRPPAHGSCAKAAKKKARKAPRCRRAQHPRRPTGPTGPGVAPAPAAVPPAATSGEPKGAGEVSKSSPAGDPQLEATPPAPAPGSPSSPPAAPADTTPVYTPPPASSSSTGGASPFRFFSPGSFWNRQLAASAPVDPQSRGIISAFETEVAREIAAKTGPWIDTTAYSVPIYEVPAGQPTVQVTLSAPSPGLTSAFRAVPLPPGAKPAPGSDGHLVVWQPSTDHLWEFWRLAKRQAGWIASWGGTMEHVQESDGVYGPSAFSGATRWWGASASSLSIAGGLITLEDLEAGVINHALAISVPNVRAGVFAAPAQRTDGTSSSPMALPEGAHLRLDPNLDLSSLHLPRLTLMIARAAQRYGIIVRDGSPSVASFYAEDPGPTGTDPYHGPNGFLEGKYPSQLMASFPWNDLELMEMELEEG
jgi:hypothetical protein